MFELVSLRYLHFLGIFALFALLTIQHMLAKGTQEALVIRKLAIIDRFYGIAALVVLICGLGLWFGAGKPAEYYSGNWIFHLKITFFVLVVLLSLGPTLYFIKARRTQEAQLIPKRIVMIIRVQLLLMCIIPLLAVMMASGAGSS